MIHSPRILVLDEPFESVDPVSSANLKDILIEYAKTGGTVIISSHVMALVEKMCTHVAVINNGLVCAAGTVDEVAAGEELEDRFLQLVGGRHEAAHLAWLDGGQAQAQAPTSVQPIQPIPLGRPRPPHPPMRPANDQDRHHPGPPALDAHARHPAKIGVADRRLCLFRCTRGRHHHRHRRARMVHRQIPPPFTVNADGFPLNILGPGGIVNIVVVLVGATMTIFIGFIQLMMLGEGSTMNPRKFAIYGIADRNLQSACCFPACPASPPLPAWPH